EPRCHDPVSPRRRPEQRHGAGEHEADPHHRDDPDRERAPRHESGPVQQQPGAGQRVPQAGAVQRHGQQAAHDHGRQEAQAEPSSSTLPYKVMARDSFDPMRVYISVDMEGIAGVVHESQTDPTTPAFAAEYGRFRRLMTAEANAAVEGALAAGATRVLVNDSHWFMRNLLAEELHQAAELVSGDPKPRSMVQDIDGGFDAALFIGYHARAGTRNAILDHTY